MTWPVRSEISTSSDDWATVSAASRVCSGSSPNALVRIGVAVRSGLTQLTRTPNSAHSSESAWVRLTSAALVDE